MKRVLLGIVAASIFSILAMAADEAPLSGQWKLQSNIQGHESNFDCTLTQKGNEITGSCKSGDRNVAITGTVQEKKVTFQYKTEYEGQELTVIHSGNLESAAKLTGMVDVQPMNVSGEFTATK